MSWNRNRFNREDDERDYGSSGRSRWERDFEQGNPQNRQFNASSQGRGFEGDYGYGRDFDYERGNWGMNSGTSGNQNRNYGGFQGDYAQGSGRHFGGSDYGQGMGNDYGRGNRGDFGQNQNYGYDRMNEWGQGNYGSQMNQGQLRGGWPRGGDYDYGSRGYGGWQEGDSSSSSTYQDYNQGNFGSNYGRGFRSRNWGQGQPDYNRDFGSTYSSSSGFQGRRFSGGFGDYDYGQGDDDSSFGSSGRGFRRRENFGSGSGSGFGGGQSRQWNQGPHSGRGPQGWQRPDDRVREDVNEALTHHGWLDASNIQVQVSGGTVTLSGTVDSRYAKRMAEDALEYISGVSDVQNNLRVQMGDEGTRAHNESFTGSTGQSTTTGRSTSGTSTSNRTKERSTT